MKKFLNAFLYCSLFVIQTSSAEDVLRPYILTDTSYESASEAATSVKSKLSAAGFDIAGEYSPFDKTTIIAVSSSQLRGIAAKTENGGFGAVIRIAITEAPIGTQVTYVNPDYMSGMYRMAGLGEISVQLETALGGGSQYGSKKGLKKSKLKKYHYMMAMPYFDDVDVLAKYATHEDAVSAVEKNLAAGIAGTSKVYRIDLEGATLFGVGMSSGNGADKLVMSTADLSDVKHSAHLPYEVLVTGNEVVALRGRFRIAQSFPDLTMGTFMKIRSAPGAIKNTLSKVASAN